MVTVLLAALMSQNQLEVGAHAPFELHRRFEKPALDDASVVVAVSSTVLHTVSEKFLSFAIDTCGVVGACGKVNWQGPQLRYFASQLAPANLRLGGSGASCVWYLLPKATSAAPPDWKLPQVCKWGQRNLTMATWAQILAFVNYTGLDFTFDLNELAGRRCHAQNDTRFKHDRAYCDGDWDPSNTRDFLEHIKTNQLTGSLVALELGNELLRMKPEWKGILTINQTVRDIHKLATVLDQVWVAEGAETVGGSSRPKLMGPGLGVCVEQDVRTLLHQTAGVLDIISFHSYPDGDGASMWAGALSIPSLLFCCFVVVVVVVAIGVVSLLLTMKLNLVRRVFNCSITVDHQVDFGSDIPCTLWLVGVSDCVRH
jgi:hypothetical protein